MSQKLNKLVLEIDKAYDDYENTKDVAHLKRVQKCLDERAKILKTKMKKVKLSK